jgi:hypothetical protein
MYLTTIKCSGLNQRIINKLLRGITQCHIIKLFLLINQHMRESYS